MPNSTNPTNIRNTPCYNSNEAGESCILLNNRIFSSRVVFKITSVLRYVEKSTYWAAKAFLIRGIQHIYSRKALLV